MLYAQVLGHELVLGTYIVQYTDLWKWSYAGVRWGGRLSIAKQCSNDNEVLLWVQYVLFSNEPLVVGDCFLILA